MTRNLEHLMRDVAGLLLKYRPSDLEAFVAFLKNDASIAIMVKIAQELEQTEKDAPKSRAGKRNGLLAAKKRRDSHGKAGNDLFDDSAGIPNERRAVISEMRSALGARQLLPDAKSIREVYARIGGKESLSGKRDQVIRTLLQYLIKLPNVQFQTALGEIRDYVAHQAGGGTQKDRMEGEYQRWFRIIYPGDK